MFNVVSIVWLKIRIRMMRGKHQRILLSSAACAAIFFYFNSDILNSQPPQNSDQAEAVTGARPWRPSDNDDDIAAHPDQYDLRGCPAPGVATAYSGMTGRLGNIMSTYANLLALQYRLGYKSYLPLYMNLEPANLTVPFLANIFNNVSLPTAHWTNFWDVEARAVNEISRKFSQYQRHFAN